MKHQREQKLIASKIQQVILPSFLIFILFIGLLHLLTGISAFKASPYNGYTLQAMAWRQGQMHLPADVPHLELAIFQNKYYVSFPPFPSVPIYLLTFLFGQNILDGLLVKLYAFIGFLTAISLLLRSGLSTSKAILYSFLLIFSTSMVPLLLTGAVWYQAQILAFTLTILAIDLIDRNRPTPAFICLALAIGCRPFNIFYGLILLERYYSKLGTESSDFKSLTQKLLPGALSALFIGILYGLYNWLRFENPLEFGHNHLPEFSTEAGIQFSLQHVLRNIRTYVFGLPFSISDGSMQRFGFSLFLANPALLILVSLFIKHLIRRKLSRSSLTIMGAFGIHLFILLLHRTFGGYQYGARYAVDLLPYAFLYLTSNRSISGEQGELRLKVIYLFMLLAGLGMSILGSVLIQIPT